MSEPIENLYFNWLCAKVIDPWSKTYRDLLIILHKTEFSWVVNMDENRALDGVELREDFLNESLVDTDFAWEASPCSMLEFFIGFAKRANFQVNRSVREWFWEFMYNLHLDEYRHITSDQEVIEIENILSTLIWRQYESNGSGGMFPIARAEHDERCTEIWYQFCDYVKDQHIY
jgi:hypothetical protein